MSKRPFITILLNTTLQAVTAAWDTYLTDQFEFYSKLKEMRTLRASFAPSRIDLDLNFQLDMDYEQAQAHRDFLLRGFDCEGEDIPQLIQNELPVAKQWIEWAYLEWEANRILHASGNCYRIGVSSYRQVVLGVTASHNPEPLMQQRKIQLISWLKPPYNREMPWNLQRSLEAAYRELTQV